MLAAAMHRMAAAGCAGRAGQEAVGAFPGVEIRAGKRRNTMKRRVLWVAAAAAAVALGCPGPAAVLAADAEQVTAAEARTHDSESWVMLEGYIAESLGDELYRFEDESGDIQVRIGPEDWRMQKVEKDTKVRVLGQLKKRGGHTEVKVDRIEAVE